MAGWIAETIMAVICWLCEIFHAVTSPVLRWQDAFSEGQKETITADQDSLSWHRHIDS
jgi:hypothetical protein